MKTGEVEISHTLYKTEGEDPRECVNVDGCTSVEPR